MNNNLEIIRLPGTVQHDVALRAKTQRKARGLTQEQLAEKAKISLGSLRRFEQTGQIAFESLVSISFALGCEADLDQLFKAPAYSSIKEVIRARKAQE